MSYSEVALKKVKKKEKPDFFDFFVDFDGYYIVRTDEGQPRPKYIFNKCGTNMYFFTLQRFGSSPSPDFKFHISYIFIV